MKILLSEEQFKRIIRLLQEDTSDIENARIQSLLKHHINNNIPPVSSSIRGTNNNDTSSNNNTKTNNSKDSEDIKPEPNGTSNIPTGKGKIDLSKGCKMELVNVEKSPKHTLSKLLINGEYVCDVLEDAIREKKIMHQTCIPEGTFEVVLTRGSKFSSQKFYKEADGGLIPWVKHVPKFSGIMIHCGTNINHTSGCLLLGTSKGPNTMQLIKSQEAWKNVMVNYLVPAWNAKVPITITVKR